MVLTSKSQNSEPCFYEFFLYGILSISVVSRHSGSEFNSDADTDPDRHQNNADPHVDPTLNLTHILKLEKNFQFKSQKCQFTFFSLFLFSS
jgi:hypothetical protein